MASELAEAHITAQERLRTVTAQAIAAYWDQLASHDEDDVPTFTIAAVLTILAAQRTSAALTNAFLARSVGRRPLGFDVDRMLSGLRAGTPLEDVYRRPFVTTWTALKNGTPYEDAVAAGRARATSTAATDVQLAMRETLRVVGEADDLILGYQRVPDSNACAFCRLIAGQRYTVEQLLPVHARCGCSVDVIRAANRGDFTGKRENDLSVTRDGVTAAVRDHGELGPVLVDGSHNFTSQADIAA